MRQRVLDFYEAGQKTTEIAERLAVSASWCRRVRQFRDRPPGKYLGRPAKLNAAARLSLAARVELQPDATLAELCDWCKSELGICVSGGTMWSVLRQMKLTLKKSR